MEFADQEGQEDAERLTEELVNRLIQEELPSEKVSDGARQNPVRDLAAAYVQSRFQDYPGVHGGIGGGAGMRAGSRAVGAHLVFDMLGATCFSRAGRPD